MAIDIMALRGTPVLAAADGTVLRMGWNDRGGHTIYHLSPGQRTLYYYAHLDGYAAGLSQGTPLLRGQVVGYVGDTGNAAPGSYHLHFEVIRIPSPESWWEGEPVNPYPLLRAVP